MRIIVLTYSLVIEIADLKMIIYAILLTSIIFSQVLKIAFHGGVHLLKNTHKVLLDEIY